MDLATQLTAHLQALTSTADHDADNLVRQVAAGLASLAVDLAAEVPSCLSVSLMLSRPTGDLTVTLPNPAQAKGLVEGEAAPVCASLAIALGTATGDAVLLLQAAHAGAFVLLADDLAVQRHPDRRSVLVDQHLVVLTDPDGGRLAVELADLRVLEQAVGALIDQGRLPAQARQELQDRARRAGLSAPDVARQLLAALPGWGTLTCS